jgi:hypothetical protein
VVIETGGDERSPIILGRPFLNLAEAIMYANTTKIYFNIKGKREDLLLQEQGAIVPCTPPTSVRAKEE